MDISSTKDKIVKAAYDCFSEKGYNATTTKEIAKTAGVSEVTLFRYFSTKSDIFKEMLKRYSFLPVLYKIKIESDGIDLQDTLKLIAVKFYNTLLERKQFVRIMLSEINHYSEEIIDIYSNFREELDSMLISIFESKICDLKLKNFDLKVASMGFIGMIYSFFLTNEIFLKKKVDDIELNNVINAFVDIFLNGIKK
ncbi:MAG: TetR/AcrR family transcriptional regulator [Calditerrivibrio nitroreducens]|uniref:TetR/AcrR family transcriptional regulator n=1 Tax=Calditerrivibrio nitroreducens TaxID=477976 RepID=A0A2J6WJC8_9BACT|nr:MAG: TetR/AcrR family transcriptional regulator [Calditerrivibrio nitroreducens]